MALKDFDPKFSSTLSLDTLTVTYAKTGTGLDYIVDQVLKDPGLNVRAPDEDVRAGAVAAAGMNTIIIEAVRATGVANDGELVAADVHILSDWINQNRLDAWKKLHGDDEKNVETGFHKVQGDGGSLHVYGDALVNQVADGIYHLGFGTKGDRLKNEDGDPNARAEKIAFWLNEILADDLKAGVLANASVTPMVEGSTGTGLDDLVEMITSDPGLDRRISAVEINKGANAADAMNVIIVDGIKALGLGDDKTLTTSEVYDLADWIKENHYSAWKTAHGNDEKGIETGFHLVQGDGAETRLEGRSAIDSIADSIYHLGFGYKFGHLINEDGDGNQSVEKVTDWLNTILADDLGSGALASGRSAPQMGTTGTGLDQLTDLILSEAELNRRLPLAEIEKGAAAADAMNTIVVDGIKALGLLNNGELSVGDLKDLSDWIVKNHKAAWIAAHGDDEKNVETGFHLVQGDGAITRGFGKNMVDTVADGIFHLGFGYKSNHLINEDGDGNAALSQVAHWLNRLLETEINSGALKNASVDPYPVGTTGTALDQVVTLLVTDPGLARNFKTSELALAARDADGLNKILLDAIKSTGVANDGNINDLDIRVIGDWIKDNALGRWSALRGDDDTDTGLMGMIWMGAASEIAGVNTVNQFSSMIYSLGYEQKWGGVIDEDGDWMGRAEDAAAWLNTILSKELGDGSLNNAGQSNTPASAFASDLVLDAPTVSGTNGDNYEIHAHSQALRLNEGTVAFTFVADDPDSEQTQVMFSKDAGGTNNGDTRVFFHDGKLYVKFSHRGEDKYVEIPHSVKAGEAHDFAMTFSNSEVSFWLDGVQVEYRSDLSLTWAQNAKDVVVGASNGHQDAGNPDRIVNEFQGDVTGFKIYDRVLDRGEIEGLSGPRGQADTSGGTATTGNNVMAASRTGTGLDQILDWIETDQGLLTRITDAEISDGSKAAGAMNKIVLEAIKATGAANDGKIDAGDVYSISDWIKVNRKADWIKYHGNDEKNVETAFHLVQNDGAVENAYGRNSINTVADAIYHLGFGYKNGRLINEDGDGNERVEMVAYWLDSLLKDDLGTGALSNGSVSTTVTGSTGTGLDALVDIIATDSELERRLPNSEQNAGAQAADDMNKIIVDSIKALGVANDGKFTASDVMALADHIKANNLGEWRTAHGDDEKNLETGFHKVQGDGAKTRLYADNAVNTVADGIYHLGFGHKRGHLINEDGDLNANTSVVAEWLNKLLVNDMAALSNSSVDQAPAGTTGTGLDQLVDAINTDVGLNLMVSLRDIQRGSDAANTMNEIIVDGIKATGIGNNGQITVSDVMVLSDYIKASHYNAWKKAHGDDEKNVETGFHLVQNDGAQGRSYAQNTVNTVADGIYHLGFGFRNGAVINEDGDRNASLSDVAGWLSELLRDDLSSGKLSNASKNPYVQGSTGTGLDAMVDMITKDVGLSNSLKTTDISKAATAADKMSEMLVEAIKATGVANDGKITSLDIVDLDDWIGDNYAAELKAQNARFEVAEVWSATSPLFGKDGINDVADALYSIGFGTKWGNALLDANGNWAAQLSDAADWLGKVLDGELKSGALYSAPNGYATPSSFASDVVVAAGRVQADGVSGYADIDHSGALSLKQGTISFDMKANSLPKSGSVTLFTKDARDKGDGHTKIYINDGELYLRMQTATTNHYMKADIGTLKAGTDYHIALVFGSAGMKLFVNGEKVMSRPDLTIDWSRNSEGVVLGASGDWRNPSNPAHVYDIFDGTISNAAIYDRALNLGEIAGLNGVNTDVQPNGTPSVPVAVVAPIIDDTTPEVVVEDTTPVVDETPQTPETVTPTAPAGDQKIVGNASANQLTGDSGNDRLIALGGDDTLDGAAGNDLLNTGSGNDLAQGGGGRDRILGLDGDDTLEGGADNDTLFGSQGDDLIKGDGGRDRIDGGAGNDVMTGGSGRDAFVVSHQTSNDGDVDRITDLDFSEDTLIIRAFAGNRQYAVSSQEELFNLNLNGLTVTSTGMDTRLSFDDGSSTSDVILSGISDPLG